MNNFKLRALVTGNENDDFVEVNGYIGIAEAADVYVDVVPFGDKFTQGLRTTATDDLGPVSNQVPGICNGTFTHTGSGSATVSATTLTGGGSGATFTYTFLADGTLSTIVAATGGGGYLVGDKLRITTSASHGSQVIEFRLVDGSNAFKVRVRMAHDRQQPLPFPVHRFQVRGTTDRSFFVLDERSQQVFPKPQDKLLDKYPDAAAAYGLRKLRSAYLGPAIRVRRASDNAEKDIYMDSQGNLDTQSLFDFSLDAGVFVKTWYDQSGNGNDASQSTNASQPRILNQNKDMVTVNGKPALRFDGSDDGFSLNHSDLYGQSRFDAYMHYQSDDNTHIMFSESTSGGKFSWVPEDGNSSTDIHSSYGSGAKLYVNGVDTHMVFATNTRDQVHTVLVTDGASHSKGAIVVHEDADTSSWSNFKWSRYGGARYFNGKMTEMVLYNTDQSANREDIEKDMALHSGAYQVEDAPLLDAYGGAHAAYSLRKLNSDYTGAAVRVRRATDNTELDLGFKSDGTLDTDAADAFWDGSNLTVKTWYDQSGNGNDVTQSTNSAQPLLYNNSGMIPLDGRPVLRFVGNDALPFDNTGLDIGNLSSFVVCKYSSTIGDQMGFLLSTSVDDRRWYQPYMTGGQFRYGYATASGAASTTANTNNNLHTAIAGATQGDWEAFLNGASQGTATLATGAATGTGQIGKLSNDYLNGFVQEIVVYSSDQSERREGIERNISNHYDL